MTDPIGILLAAGAGKRFDPSGQVDKLTASFDAQFSIAQKAAYTLLQELPEVLAVVRNSILAEQLQSIGCKIVLFPDAEQGMGSSLAYAMNCALKIWPNTESVMIALADMPYIQRTTIQQVAHALRLGHAIVQPVCQEVTGHPVGFSRKHFAALRALSGDVGARSLLKANPAKRISVIDDGILKDIDNPSELPNFGKFS